MTTMSRLRIVQKDMQSRAQHVARLIHKQLEDIADEAHEEGWDGREMLTGLAVAFGQACAAVQVSPAQAIDMVQRLDLPELKREYSQIVAPNGRPLAKVT
jgi:hypothetical protein